MTETSHQKTKIVPALDALATPIDRLELLPGNPRRGNIEAVAASLATFGQRKPIVANRDGTVIAGNHTLQAARSLGWSEIAVVFVDDDDTTAKAYALADNRTAELGSYDDTALATLIAEVRDADEEMLAATGWTDDDLTSLLEQIDAAVEVVDTPDPDDTPIDTAPKLTVPGDIWQLGPHRIMCGDASIPTDVDRLLDGATIHLAVTSPPYAEQRTYDETSGFKPIPPDEYVAWFAPIAANVAAHLADDGSWLVNIKPAADQLDRTLYVFDLVTTHVREWGWHFGDEFCWERNGVPKQPVLRLKNQFEPVYQFARGRWKFRPGNVAYQSENAIVPFGPGRGNTSWADPDSAVVSQGQKGDMFAGQRMKRRKNGGSGWGGQANGDDVQGTNWQPGLFIGSGTAYPGNRLPTFAGTHEATGHTAAYPVGLPAFFIQLFTDQADNVYDPFCGSGSTILAAHQHDRTGYGMELSPAYVDIICRRWQRHTGILPVNAATGRAHDFDPD